MQVRVAVVVVELRRAGSAARGRLCCVDVKECSDVASCISLRLEVSHQGARGCASPSPRPCAFLSPPPPWLACHNSACTHSNHAAVERRRCPSARLQLPAGLQQPEPGHGAAALSERWECAGVASVCRLPCTGWTHTFLINLGSAQGCGAKGVPAPADEA